MMIRRLFLAALLVTLSLDAYAADSLWRQEGSPAFVDADGNPRASAELCYFEAGTTTTLAVYTDAALSTAHSQPIILNSAGALDDPIYIPQGTDFKEVLLDTDNTTCSGGGDGTVLFTSDEIPASLTLPTAQTYARPRSSALSKTGAYTVVASDMGRVINASASGGAFTITLPAASAVTSGDTLTIRKTDNSANAVTISGTINEGANWSLDTQFEDVTLTSDGTAWRTRGELAAAEVTFAQIATSAYSTDDTLAGASDSELVTEGSVKAYVDSAVTAGINWLDPVVAASTAALTKDTDIENGDTVDGIVLSTSDRVLLKDQATASENGIWIVAASGAPTRATDMDQAAEFLGGTVYVSGGTANGGNQYTQTATVSSVDTDDVTFSLIASSLTYAADESTLTLSGTEFSVASGGITATEIATGAVGADEIATDGVGSAELAAAVEPGVILLATGTASAVSELDLNLSSFSGTYRAYRFVLTNVVAGTDGQDLRLRVSTDGGSTFEATAGDYQWENDYIILDDVTYDEGSANASYIELMDFVSDTAADAGACTFEIADPDSTTAVKFVDVWGCQFKNADGNFIRTDMANAVFNDAASDVDAVRIYFSTGNITSLSYAVYGLR